VNIFTVKKTGSLLAEILSHAQEPGVPGKPRIMKLLQKQFEVSACDLNAQVSMACY
jgi:hypothetical protein